MGRGTRGGGEGGAGLLPSRSEVCIHYLIVPVGRRGVELPHTLLDSGEEVLPVFCSREAAQRFLKRRLGDGWCVREFSTGELISLLFALHGRIRRILPNPLPEHPRRSDPLAVPVSWDRFMEFLVEG